MDAETLARIQPLGDRILIRLLDEVISKSIIVPECAQHPGSIGRVIRVGPGRRDKKGRLIPCEVKPGDIIRFHPTHAIDFKQDGLGLTTERDVLFIQSGNGSEES